MGDIYRFWNFSSNDVSAKINYVAMIYFSRVNNLTKLHLWNGRSWRKKWVGDICRFLHLPSNDVISKIVLYDLDLLFEGEKYKQLYLWNGKSYRKNVWKTFVDYYICHRMVSLQKFYFVTLTYFLKVKMLKFYIRNGKS